MEKTKRTPAKLGGRTPIKIKKPKTPPEESVFGEMFSGIATPQQQANTNVQLGQLTASDVSPDQLAALQRENFALWASTSGIEVDHKPFNFDRHKYLLPLYMDMSKEICLMKAAQMGATIWMLLRLLHFTLHNSAKACLFFPTQDGVSKLSKDRLKPLIDSNNTLSCSITDTDTIGYKKIGEKSSLYLQHMGGEATKDSTPFDMICFDEVRLLNPADIDQARERISHSEYKQIMQVSTAGYPGCFAAGTLIACKHKRTGKITPIDIADLAGMNSCDDFQVLSYNRRGGNRLRWRDIKAASYAGQQHVVNVSLWGGYKIKCTPDHPFAKLAEASRRETIKWVPIEDFKRFPNRFGGTVGPTEGPLRALEIPEYANGQWGQKITDAPFDKNTLVMIGCYIAEGSIKRTEMSIWQTKNSGIQEFSVKWAQQQDLHFRSDKHGVHISLSRRPDLLKLFRSCGTSAQKKHIPEYSVLVGSKAQLGAVLTGILWGDGHIRKPRSTTKEARKKFDIYTSSKQLASQLLFVGLRLGYSFAISQRMREGKRHYCVSYNPHSFHAQEVFPQLGQAAVASVKYAGVEAVYDLQVEGYPAFVLAESGCLVHNSDISRVFLKGTQNYWHVTCNCSDGFIPSECWPDCIAVTTKEVYLQCPKCRKRIDHPQEGRYIPHNPGADFPSYHISQFISDYITVAEIWDNWQRTQNIKEFYNAKLGKPYVDEENQPVKDDDLAACENTDILWGKGKAEHGGKIRRAMGVDQMGGNNYAVICELHAEKKRIVHYEVIDDRNPEYMIDEQRTTPFKRLYQLMNEWDIDLCIIDAMPNINEALEFARTFPKRVFVAWYIEGAGAGQGRDMVQWGDKAKDKQSVRRGGPRIKFKYTAMLNRYMSIDFALSEIANRNCEWPVPENLIQTCRSLDTGLFEPLHIFRTHFYRHMKAIVRQKTIIDEETGRFRMEWVNLGIDPHSVHSWNLCNIALERLRRVPLMTFM
jgi:hypothetical protein